VGGDENSGTGTGHEPASEWQGEGTCPICLHLVDAPSQDYRAWVSLGERAITAALDLLVSFGGDGLCN